MNPLSHTLPHLHNLSLGSPQTPPQDSSSHHSTAIHLKFCHLSFPERSCCAAVSRSLCLFLTPPHLEFFLSPLHRLPVPIRLSIPFSFPSAHTFSLAYIRSSFRPRLPRPLDMSDAVSLLRRLILESPPGEWALNRLRELLIGALRQGPVPQHVAFEMDGNRRYARSHRMETVEGHHRGFEALARVCLASPSLPLSLSPRSELPLTGVLVGGLRILDYGNLLQVRRQGHHRLCVQRRELQPAQARSRRAHAAGQGQAGAAHHLRRHPRPLRRLRARPRSA